MKSAIGDIFSSIAASARCLSRLRDLECHVRTRLIGTILRRRDIGGERVGERMANSVCRLTFERERDASNED